MFESHWIDRISPVLIMKIANPTFSNSTPTQELSKGLKYSLQIAIALEVFGVEGRRVLAAPAASSRAAEATREVK